MKFTRRVCGEDRKTLMKISVSEMWSTYLALGYFRSCPVCVTAHYQTVVWRGESKTGKKCHQIRRKRGPEKKKRSRPVCPAEPDSLIRKQERGGKRGEDLPLTRSSKYTSVKINFSCIIGLTHKLRAVAADAGIKCALACFAWCLAALLRQN